MLKTWRPLFINYKFMYEYKIGDCIMIFSKLDQDSRILGGNVYKFDVELPARIIELGDLCTISSFINATCLRHNIEVLTCRINPNFYKQYFLHYNNFVFIESILSPRRSLDSIDEGSLDFQSEVTFRKCQPAEILLIEEMAKRIFVYDRFSWDKRMNVNYSGDRYEDWVKTAVEMEHYELYVAQIMEEIVGFFIVEFVNDSTIYWHLNGIDERFQGKGIGKKVWASAMKYFKSLGYTHLETSISSNNLATINLYRHFNFHFEKLSYTFHRINQIIYLCIYLLINHV